jgi:O-antigen/teichoic acid export membrane protein
MVFNVASITIVGMDKQKILLRILMISTMINIISNITLISLFGVIGSAMSVVITYGVIYYSGHLYLYKKENIKIKLILLTYGKLILITIILISSYNLYFKYVFNELISALIITILYIMLILIMLFSKDDIRIIKEMLQIT